MMRRLTFVCCCTALALVGCASEEQATADTAAGAVGATAAPAPATISIADVTGTWNFRSVPETGPDTTPTQGVLTITADTANWTLTLPNRAPVKSRVVAIAGDSIVTETGPYESVRRRGVQVTTNTVVRLRDGRLIGTAVAHYRTTGPDSVVRFRLEATKAP